MANEIGLKANYVTGEPLPAAEVNRLHAVVNTQLKGALELRGGGVLASRFGDNSLKVSAGAGLQVLVAPGAGIILGSTEPTAYFERGVVGGASLPLVVPASSTSYIWAILDSTPGTQTIETRLALIMASPSETIANAIPLATVTTSANAVTLVIDTRGLPIDRVDPEQVQDAVGALVQDSVTLDATYNDASNALTIEVKPGTITSAHIADGTIVNADIAPAAAIDASKIGGGAVSNQEFGYLDGVTSAIQNQLDAKAAAAGVNDIEITNAAKGVILKSPNGTRWRVTIDDSGALVRTSL